MAAEPAALPAAVATEPMRSGDADRLEMLALRRANERASRERRQAAEAAAAHAAAQASAQASGKASGKALRKPRTSANTTQSSRKAARQAPGRTRAKAETRTAAQTAPVAPADGSRASVVVGFALAQVGKPYIWASTGPRGFDCSGLVLASFRRVGINLPTHKADDIGTRGRAVPRSQWQPGDVLHWSGHVGIYIGGNKVVHAPGRGRQITVATVWDSPRGRRLL